MFKILVIEDEEILREELLEWLTLEDYVAIGASDGIQGLELAHSEKPDLIISDITMPKLDGHGVLLELNSDPLTAGIPFIFVTARASHDDMRTGMKLGADDYITKPFSRTELLEAVEARLKKKVLQAEEFQQEIDYWHRAFKQEHEQRLLKAKMVGMFSHDFRNPLSLILSSVDLVRNYESQLSPERKAAHLNKIESSVKLLQQMLDDMLMIAQMEGDYLEYEPQSVELSSFVGSIVDDFARIHIDSHSINYLCELEGTFELDVKLFANIVSNLLSNAIKYSPTADEVSVAIKELNDNSVLSVQDKGIGIPQQNLENICEPFNRAENVNQIKGTGLGLSIVKRCVDLHQGSLSIESQESLGSTFSVTIPMIRTNG